MDDIDEAIIRASIAVERVASTPKASKKEVHRTPLGEVLGAPVGVNESRQDVDAVDPKDYQEIAIMALADEFFKTNEVNLELRTYLLENAIPTMMLALEKLLKEVDQRGMVEDETTLRTMEVSSDTIKTTFPKNMESVPGDRSCLEIQIDKPEKPAFDPINWLAQFLYRNNPRYVNASDVSNHPYFQQLRAVSQHAKARLFEFQLTQRAKQRAEAMARKREKERLKKARTQQMEEMRSLFDQLLSTVFKKWTGKLWRIVNGSISKTEMLDAYQSLLESHTIQANDAMISKVSDLIKYLSMSTEVADRMRIEFQKRVQTSEDSPSNEDSPNENETPGQEAAGSTETVSNETKGHELANDFFCLSPEYLTAEKWDITTFVDGMMILTDHGSWTIDDLSTFLMALAAYIDSLGEKLLLSFNNIFYVPRFQRPSTKTFSPKDEWRHKLAKLVIEFGDKNADSLKGSLMDYCRGNVTLSQLGVTQAAIPENNLRSIPENNVSSPFGRLQDEVQWSKGAAEAEDEFKKFMMVMVGLYGLPSSETFFRFLKRKAEEEAALFEKERHDAEVADMQNAVSSEDMQARIQKIMSLFVLVQNANVTAETVNLAIDKISNALGSKLSPQTNSILMKLKYKGIKKELEKIRISSEDFVARILDSLQISNEDFDNLLKVLGAIFESMVGQDSGEALEAIKTLEKQISSAQVNRADIQSQAMHELNAISKRNDMSIAEYAEQSVHILGRAVEQFHKEHRISTRLSLVESGVLKAETSGETEQMIVERFLRVVACSIDTKSILVGAMFPPEQQGFEGKTMTLGKPFQSDDCVNDTIMPPKLLDNRVGKYLGLPLISAAKKPVGVIGMTLIGPEDGGYVQPDIDFLASASSKIIETIERIDAREKNIQIAQAAAQYMREKIGDTSNLRVYLNLPAVERADKEEIYGLLERPYSPIVKDPRLASAKSREMAANPDPPDIQNAKSFARYLAGASGHSNIERIHDDAPEINFIHQATKEREMINGGKNDQGGIDTYIPILDDDKKVFCVVGVSKKDGNGEVSDEDLNEIRKITNILSTCASMAKKEKFGDDSIVQHLDGEAIDEESRRALLFPKMMLVSARQYLSKLDNKAISELKSYKKPPIAVLKVLKAVLYLHGKKPKEVAKWADVVKFVNMDLLKAMVSYDPTALQKKIRFKRCNRILHSLSKVDIKKKSSIPTLVMFDWLIISLDLRRRAVEARKRHPLVFAESTALETEETPEAGEDEAENADEGEAEPPSTPQSSST
ncbi:hypothetical protein BC830DRAFT_1091244 [Chytriomyces sp. MP71]|nr:hypothetical protein BC830DRAFT_1091244 [Chytriomyces sp. MP71]